MRPRILQAPSHHFDVIDESVEKQLSRLLDQAFMVDSIEGFVRLVGQQASSIKNKIGEIVLCYPSSYFGPRQYCLKGKRLYERVPQKNWPQVFDLRSCDKQDSIYLANELGRPFHKILALPLDSPYKMEKRQPVLFIEYGCQTKTIEQIFYQEKRDILRSAFSRVLLEDHWKSGCELWQHTFDSLNEPLAILDEGKEPVRSNTHFQNIYQKDEKLLKQDVFQLNGQTYEKKNYFVSNDDKKYKIEHFVNRTSYLELKEKITQHQKMSILGKIADDVAHQLNNPLTGLRSMSQILAQECSDKMQKDYFNEIEKASHRCQKIIKNFIQFSKQFSVDTHCNVNKITTQTISFLKTIVGTKNIILKLDEEAPLVRAEPCLLQQVVFNLLKNALEAVDDKGEVEIQTTVEGDRVWVSVTDDGCGIGEDDYKKLFDPFFTTKKNGTGLGLRISRQFIEKFGGELIIESQVGQGSCFKFYLLKVEE